MTDTTIIFVVDGMRYPIDIDDLTGNECQLLKKHSGLLGPSEIWPALVASDIQTAAAVIGIAMQRAGQTPNFAELQKLSKKDIVLEFPVSEKKKKDENPTKGAEKKETSAPSGTPS